VKGTVKTIVKRKSRTELGSLGVYKSDCTPLQKMTKLE
jgi:hypothetical protein